MMKTKLGILMVYFKVSFFAFLFNNCAASKNEKVEKRLKKNIDELVIKVNAELYNWKKAGDTLKPPCSFLYKDSFMLLKDFVLYGKHSKEIDTTYFRIAFYRFEDLRNKVAYFYKEFTPEAKLWGKLPTDVPLDSLTKVHNGFYITGKLNKKNRENLVAIPIMDTVVNNITYKRINTTFYVNNHIGYESYWALKNDTLLPFSYLPYLSKETGLAYVKSEFVENNNFSPVLYRQGIELERNYFTAEERMVFDAWRKNCNKYKNRKIGVDEKAKL